MNFSFTQIVLFIIAYLTGLFAVAHLADRGIISRRITRHPAVYVLSLGVFTGALATNGIIELAASYGFSALLYYAGVALMFFVGSLFLLPMLRVCRVYQLSSLADVLAFRFRSQWVGAAITIAMCITVLPLLALQIQAVSDSIHILQGDTQYLLPSANHQDGLAFGFCLIITVFAIAFGTRHVSAARRNEGLVAAIAFESLVKLAAMMALMMAAIYGVFDGLPGLEAWLEAHPEHAGVDGELMPGGVSRTLLLIFFAGAVCMPHMFHMALAENTESEHLRYATWGLPLYLMLLSLPLLPIAWAGIVIDHDLPLQYTGLALGEHFNRAAISGAAFVAGLSAASATMIVSTLALANMCLNHLILPTRFLQIDSEQSIYAQLKWLRRTLITVLILGGYTFFVVIAGQESLMQLGVVAFIGTTQFLPGVAAAFYWPKANRNGLLAGLALGLGVWFVTLLLPIISNIDPLLLRYLAPEWQQSPESLWVATSMVALTVNTAAFVLVSLLWPTSEEERLAADICSMDDLSRPRRQVLTLHSPEEFTHQLASALGHSTASEEVDRALAELQFSTEEARPYALRRLRSRIEANLSGLLGPAVAHSIINRCIPFQASLDDGTDDINLIERNLDLAQIKFTGLAADLNNLRRHYQETLDKLPMGVCSVSGDGEFLIWNRSMEKVTGIPAEKVLGALLDSLPEPWRQLLGDFILGRAASAVKQEVPLADSSSRWITLHKASVEHNPVDDEDRVILVEDITDYAMLEQELVHSERLASIGRLAAGVAHEIGNPVTGIACLAQNLEFESDRDEIQIAARDILKQTERVTRIVESLVNFSHTGSGPGDAQLAPCNLADCVDEAVHLLSLDHQAPVVTFNNHCDRELVVQADSQRLLQVFINLLGNARDACPDNGEIRVTARSDGQRTHIDVEDNGTGIPPEVQQRVFEPFFTTKDPGEGTGLGLALVYSIMEDMGGSVLIESPIHEPPQKGTRVSLVLASAHYGSEFEVA